MLTSCIVRAVKPTVAQVNHPVEIKRSSGKRSKNQAWFSVPV